MFLRCFKNTRSVFVVLICFIYSNVNCVLKTTYFVTDATLNNKICTDSEKIFQLSVRSKLMCSNMCENNPECATIFYERDKSICTICRGRRNVIEKSGTICYFKNINCNSPLAVDGGTITSVEGYTAGDQASYTCSSCSHSPAGGVGIIRCQADGTWTTPKCSPAIDVGYLPNGQLIPPGATGCMSTKGSRCLEFSMSPHVMDGLRSDGSSGGCWCGALCCNSYCCYDVKC
ncbi:uncharacterized protein LOC132758073 [Ruditapes philippinarum]|uniref:uncharacterized protein LOC132758073 n=1 Tax=Ruditapes philippinarum TaxID=129788 RepID=UPI00295ADA66|nr:uncharacterized protein LOC132758073 [Ruditapes philippinarum]